MISFELKWHLIVINLIVGTSIRIVSCYIFVIPLGLGVFGVYLSDLGVTILRIVLTNMCLIRMDWDKFEGVKLED